MDIKRENCFIFTMNGLNEDNSEQIDANRWLYCICLKYIEPLYKVKN